MKNVGIWDVVDRIIDLRPNQGKDLAELVSEVQEQLPGATRPQVEEAFQMFLEATVHNK